MPLEGAKVIWGPNWQEAKNGEKRLFIEEFKTFCDSPVSVHAGADN